MAKTKVKPIGEKSDRATTQLQLRELKQEAIDFRLQKATGRTQKFPPASARCAARPLKS